MRLSKVIEEVGDVAKLTSSRAFRFVYTKDHESSLAKEGVDPAGAPLVEVAVDRAGAYKLTPCDLAGREWGKATPSTDDGVTFHAGVAAPKVRSIREEIRAQERDRARREAPAPEPEPEPAPEPAPTAEPKKKRWWNRG